MALSMSMGLFGAYFRSQLESLLHLFGSHWKVLVSCSHFGHPAHGIWVSLDMSIEN